MMLRLALGSPGVSFSNLCTRTIINTLFHSSKMEDSAPSVQRLKGYPSIAYHEALQWLAIADLPCLE